MASHVIKSGDGALLVFSSVYTQDTNLDMNVHLVKHGDGVKDIAFEVENCKAIYEAAMKGGAVSVMAPYEMKDDNGSVWTSSVKTYGDTTHTFI